jgi:hypothetical protein
LSFCGRFSALERFLPKDVDFSRASSLVEWKLNDFWKIMWRFGKIREEIEIPG